MDSIMRQFIRLITIPTVFALILAILFYSWVTPKSVDVDISKRLPDSIIEDEQIANYCAEMLQEKIPFTWTINQARKCIDNLNGYTDPTGQIIHPFE